MSEEYTHLNQAGKDLAVRPDKERIQSIKVGSWISYPLAKDALEQMETILDHPRVVRMPNLLLVAPSNNGKSSILERFRDLHPPIIHPDAEATEYPVVLVEAPFGPDVSALYTRILEALMAPFKLNAPAEAKYSQIKILFRTLGVKVLLIDEIQHLIAGSLTRQQNYRNALKSLGNETKVSIIAAGTADARNAFNTDVQMSSRFVPFELPTWKANRDLGGLLATLESRTPLRKPSYLKAPEMMLEIFSRSEGTLGDVCDLVQKLAIDAIEKKKECITVERVRDIRWVPPSKRKQFQHV